MNEDEKEEFLIPYLPCTDLQIGIDGEPDALWIIDFFKRLDNSELGSPALIDRDDDMNNYRRSQTYKMSD